MIDKINFTSGLIKIGKKYINPNSIKNFEPFYDEWEGTKGIKIAYINHGSEKIQNINEKQFALTFIKAINSDNIVDYFA